MNGVLEFVDTADFTSMGGGEHFMCTDVEWDPTGWFFFLFVIGFLCCVPFETQTSRAICDDWSVLVGAQGGQRLLAVELPGENLEEELCGEVLSARLEAKVLLFLIEAGIDFHS